jgi:hypothetical protein
MSLPIPQIEEGRVETPVEATTAASTTAAALDTRHSSSD